MGSVFTVGAISGNKQNSFAAHLGTTDVSRLQKGRYGILPADYKIASFIDLQASAY